MGKTERLSFTVLGCGVRVQCEDAEVPALLATNYGPLQGSLKTTNLDYAVSRKMGNGTLLITREGQEPLVASDRGELLSLFEHDLLIQIQLLRSDLYFLHSAVVEFAGRAALLVAASGGGKSTTTWALLHHGFRYVSDELAPVNPGTLRVHPYPRALCLKEKSPELYPPPERILATAQTLRIPVEDLPSGVCRSPVRVAAIFFLRYDPQASGPTLRPISKAEAGARLFANALNPLAHPGDGLDGAIGIATRSACFELVTADLPATCALVTDALRTLFRNYGTFCLDE